MKSIKKVHDEVISNLCFMTFENAVAKTFSTENGHGAFKKRKLNGFNSTHGDDLGQIKNGAKESVSQSLHQVLETHDYTNHQNTMEDDESEPICRKLASKTSQY